MAHTLRLKDFPIFYINCKNNLDRKISMETQLDLWDCDYTRVEAIQKEDYSLEELDILLPNFLKRKKNEDGIKGQMCCFLSHIKALELAGSTPCIIMEDDNIIETDVIGEAPPHNSMISYLCGYYWLRGKFAKEKPSLDLPLGLRRAPWMLISRPWLKIATSNAIMYHRPDKVLSILKTSRPRPFDIALIEYVQQPFATYIHQPSIIKPDFMLKSTVTTPGKRTLKKDRVKYI